MAGLYYLRETSGFYFSVWGSSLDGALGFPNAALGGDGRQRVTSIAPYVQADYELSDQFTITAGLRYTKEKKRLLSNDVVVGPLGSSGFPDPEFVRAPVPIVEVKFNEFTPKATLSYKPVEDVMLYATYARGFKSGGINLPAFGPVDTVEPEILDDFEVGWKAQTGTIRFNGAAFYYKYKDLQFQITDQTTGGTRVVNAAKADIKGVEFDLTWAPNDVFEFGTGGGYLDAKYKNFIGDVYMPCGEVAGLSATTPVEIGGKNAAIAGCGAQGGLGLALVSGRPLSGNRLANAPKWSGYIRGQVTQPLGNAMGTIMASSILNFRSKAFFDAGNRFVDRKRALLSARLAWMSEDEKYSVTPYGENLTGKKYNLFHSPQATGGWQITAPPRQIYLQLAVRY